ncbi:nucleotidyltransferase family protein [Snuella sp. CAU 1569]|uniref:Nucleotidyltransferase family protein n=1 Tax=Snuella sedimenti TaxID=2798802 RepID=A0A8J7IGP1_9FLAO|nr:nucleotidyltransferase family protein [Snuella sedimenti]
MGRHLFCQETAASIVVRLNPENNIEYIARYGLKDLFNLKVVPTPGFDLHIYKERITTKL